MVLLMTFGITSAQIKKAERLYNAFEYSKAIPVYERIASSSNKNSTLALVRLGDIYRMTSKFEQSADSYKKAIEKGGVQNDVYVYYGQVLQSLGEYEKAVSQFNKYSELVPGDNRGKLLADYCMEASNFKVQDALFELVNTESINTSFSDFSPIIANNELVFTSDRNDGLKSKTYGWTGAYYLDLYKASYAKDDQGKITLGDAVPLSSVLNQAYHDGPASFSSDYKTVYLTRAFHKIGEIDSSRFYTNKLKIFSATHDGNQWTQPVPFYLNNDSYSVGHPSISNDGKTLYFVSDMPGGFGGTDIYTVELVNGQWTNLKNLGAEINTFGNEMFPNIDKDNTLYFSSNGWPGLGSLDVFSAKLMDGKWSKPENLKEPVNSTADDFGFFKVSETNTIFMSSNRAGGKGGDDIYIVKEKPIESVLVAGLVKDRESGEILPNSTVFAWNNESDEVLVLKTDDKGMFNTYIKPGTSYTVKSIKSGYSTDCLDFSIPAVVNKRNFTTRDLLLVKLQVNQVFELENIYYDFDKWNIRKDASVELDRVIDFLKQNPDITAELGSHTDSRGTDRYNEKLSLRRAESAVSYITSKGIEDTRITAKGYGETQLINKCMDNVNCTEPDHQLNRRTEIKITGVDRTENKNVEPLEAYKHGQLVPLKELDTDFFNDCTDKKNINVSKLN